ncbi:hypothetical protein FY528_17490 [Hymenobacter lutimineralis]|uniref:Uncharacterized protein n=1 Tax=Hymenobacter lutimineralis TaxID=2606448 RepID=A0A5D6UW85_9BACT|nr:MULTISPECIES: hypothetical protein [Hymenobacter]QIX59953.1 hypothetical protein HER32_01595 [Hymenobacter sp. BT18]TYZ06659.1 hypothetical protein FY528_17490 [Hymenobacter lutimineralis]
MPEKLQTILWILVALGVFIWRMIQKARATTSREKQERRFSQPDSTGKPRPVVTAAPAKSFEELLQQMMTENKAAPTASTATTPAGRALPQEKAKPARSLEATPPTARSLETPAPKRKARSQEAPAAPARRASALPRAAVQHGQEDYWSRQAAQAQTPGSVAEQLQNPASVRQAFILSEILQRRF